MDWLQARMGASGRGQNRKEGLKCQCLVTEDPQGSLMGCVILRDLEARTGRSGRLLG